MKPIKPKKMPKRLEEMLRDGAAHWDTRANTTAAFLNKRECRAILAALEYERQRADSAEKKATAAALEVDRCRAELAVYKPWHWHD